ncbi:MAG TPA: hypothetical protein VGH96_08025 [Streptosporangiaceae bacterium]|jgi:hypothetical protein
MTSIRIALATALIAAAALAGGTGHARPSEAPAATHPVAFAAPHPMSPPLCC